MRVRLYVLGILLVAVTGNAAAQTAATYAERALLFRDETSIGRVAVASTRGALKIGNEPESTPDHEVRAAFADMIIREPEVLARRMIVVMGSSGQVPVTATPPPPLTGTTGAAPPGPVPGTKVEIAMTDQEMQAFIETNWSAFATRFVRTTPSVPPASAPAFREE